MTEKKQFLKVILRPQLFFEVYELSVNHQSIQGQWHMGMVSGI